LRDDAAREQLAQTIAASNAQAAQLYQTAAAKIAARLAAGGDPTGDKDLLRALREAGFVRIDTTGPGSFPPSNATLLVVASGVKDARPPQNEFFVPLLRALSSTERDVVVGEPFACSDSLNERVRSDGDLRAAIATVDDADVVLGRVALVSAIRSVAAGLATQHLGARRSATALVPQS
jgi:hypothetical protein